MSDFSYLAQNYDPAAVEEAINDFEKELQDEQALSETLGSDTATKVEHAQGFIDAHNILIHDQHQRLMTLNKDLKDLVKTNKVRQSSDSEYATLIASSEYKDLADMMLEIKTSCADLKDFLVTEGVRGRPNP